MMAQIPQPKVVRWHIFSAASVLVFRMSRSLGFWSPLHRLAIALTLRADRYYPREDRRRIGGLPD